MFCESDRLKRQRENQQRENQQRENLLKRFQEEPLYEVIYRDIEVKISTGKLKTWMWLDSIRQTAKDSEISIITVKRAYERLQADGLICSKPGIGYFVAEDATEKIKERLRASAEEHFEMGIYQAFRAGLDDKAVMTIVNNLLDLME